MERLLVLIAGFVALSVMLLLPATAAYSGYQSTVNILRTEAEINARLTSQLVNANPELWKVETLRLEELLRRRPLDRTPEVRSVLDAAGALVSAVRDEVGAPHVEAASPVYDSGRVVGTLRVQRSLRPLLVQTAWFALLGVLLGGAVFTALKVLPLRALHRTQERLVHEATHDALTGLPNRVLFRDRLEQAMRRCERTGRPMALLYLDVDRFKDINDSLGHEAGDRVLRHVARILQSCVEAGIQRMRRSADSEFTIARLGGDEFTVLLESAAAMQDVSSLAERILEALQAPVAVGGNELVVSGSLGIALYPHDHATLDTLLCQADMAMYRAKDLGRNTYQYFNDELNRSIQHRIALEQSLRGALERGEFRLHYQPKAHLATGAVTGVEALLRWERPGFGLVGPDAFIPALEESRLIVPVGAWVIETACAQLVAWDRAGMAGLSMAVNLSARQFHDRDLPQRIADILRTHDIAPCRLELELTESLLMEDNELSRKILLELARVGVRVAIDDFGTGHSSLAYLKRFKVDTLKMDRSFVRDLPHDAAIATAVTALAHSLSLSVVCEGVETAEQLAFLRTLDCDAIQGFFLGRPMPVPAIDDWLRRHRAGDEALTAWRRLAPAAPRREPRRLVATQTEAA